MVEYVQVGDKIQQAYWREIKPYRVYRNMKRYILETNLEGQGW